MPWDSCKIGHLALNNNHSLITFNYLKIWGGLQWGSVRVAWSLVFCWFLFALFLLAIVLSVYLWFTDSESDNPFGTFYLQTLLTWEQKEWHPLGFIVRRCLLSTLSMTVITLPPRPSNDTTKYFSSYGNTCMVHFFV